MKLIVTFSLLIIWSSTVLGQDATIYRSSHDFETTIFRLDSIIKSKKLIYHKIVNYDDDMKEEINFRNRLFIFEDEGLSKQVLECNAMASLDLPLKILVWNDGDEVFLSYVDPHFMKRRFQLKECNEKLHALTKLLVRVTNECIKT